MSYIGNVPTTASFPFDQFSGTGSQVNFTLSQAPASTTSIAVTVSGVTQNPNTYSVSGTTLTFTSAPASGTNNIGVLLLGLPTLIGVPSSATVGLAQLSATGTPSASNFLRGDNTWATAVADGDKGDITVSASGATWTIDSGAVTPDKLSTQVQYTGFKNRIINGDMRIDQRNVGSEVNPAISGSYYLDRWIVQATVASKFKIGQNAGAVTPPAGFTYYLGCTSLSAYTVGSSETFNVQQRIEGFNVADFGWGTASAETVVLSFLVYSSLTGTFGGVLRNNANDRSYPFTFNVSTANTWTPASITILGETTGTWLTNNGAGIRLIFSLGTGATASGTAGSWASTNYSSATGAVSVVGTSGATFYVTGVQLEKGTQATSFDYKPYATELSLCQRYYYKIFPNATSSSLGGLGYVTSATNAILGGQFPVALRTAPAALEQSGTAANYATRSLNGGVINCSSVPTYTAITNAQNFRISFIVASGLTAGQPVFAETSTTGSAAYLAWSAEL